MWRKVGFTAAASVTVCEGIRARRHAPKPVCCESAAWAHARKLGYVDEIPGELVVALKRGKCVAMVGAGLSYPAGLPGFEGLLSAVAESTNFTLILPAGGSYDDMDKVQFRLAEHVGKERLCSILRSMLFIDPPFSDAMQVVLNAFSRLPFAAVVSWNWDNILDSTYTNAPNNERGFRAVLSSEAATMNYTALSTPLLKMQGDLSDPPSVVVTEWDYERRTPAADVFLARLHESRTVLYVGMSLRPGGVGSEKRAGSLHYAILNDVTPERRQDLIARFNIYPLSYDSKATQWRGSQIIMEELASRVYETCS